MSKDRPGTAKDAHYARLRRRHRDSTPRAPGPPAGAGAPLAPGLVRLYGLHAVGEALRNPVRRIKTLTATRNALARLGIDTPDALPFAVAIVEPKAIDRMTGPDAVHQGVVLETEPLTPKPLEALADARLVVVLDQVTDPHNVGAVMRSAVAFGADALITTARHSPAESGVLAKAASGALEHIDLIQVTNLARALTVLHEAGFRTIGLDSEAPVTLEQAIVGGRIALVLGAEGKGLRAKTRDTVTTLARLDMRGAIRSLNVSNAAAIALYATMRAMPGS